MLVMLRRISVSYFEDYGLRGFIETEPSVGQARTYSFRLPTPTEPNPPGWASIGRLANVTSEQVIEAWDEASTANTVAQSAALEVSARYAGERFSATEVKQEDGSVVLELGAHLDVSVAAPKALATLAPQAIAPVHYTSAYDIGIDLLPNGSQLFVALCDVARSNWPVFRVPDDNDQTPPDWWFVECFTGISHQRVVEGWSGGQNPVLADALRLFAEVVAAAENQVPLREDNTVDMNLWRREMNRRRFQSGQKPFVFIGRPDHNVMHTKSILYDVAGDYLFRVHVEPGRSQGTPALITDSDGKVRLRHLDNVDVARGVLNRFIRFARTGKPPKPLNPSKELLADFIYFPDQSWPVIEGIVRIPTVRSDGTIITAAGYDKPSRLWHAPEFELEPVPDRPTQDEIERARALLLTPIADFPFVDEGARTGALACLFEQIVRPMIRGPRPLYIFDAPAHGPGTGKCCEVNSLAVSSHGLLSLAEMLPSTVPSDTAHEYQLAMSPPEVPTADGVIRPASHIYNGGWKPTRRLRTRRGFEVEGTFVHPVRVASAEGPVWKKLEDLKAGDYVAINVARHPGAGQNEIDIDLGWLLGSLTADGSLNKYDGTSSGLCYTKNDPVLRARVAKLAETYLDAEVVEEEDRGVLGLRFNNAPRVRDRMTELDLSQTTAAFKKIPRSVRVSSSRVWASFLCGLFDGDATVDKQGFEWTTASEELGKQVQVMLAALGVWSTRKPKPVQLEGWSAPRTYWRVTFGGADLDAYADVVGFTHEEKARRLFELVEDDRVRNTNLDVIPHAGDLIREVYHAVSRTKAERCAWKREMTGKRNPSRARLRRFVEATPVPPGGTATWERLFDMTADHIRWDRVEEVSDGEAYVADLSVPYGHSFVANGVQVHNTLLAKVFQAVITGGAPVISALGKREEEVEKRITSILLDDNPFVIFDNLTQEITSEALQQLATSERWQARLLGVSESPILWQNATWVLTLNGARMNKDIARRVVMVRLEAATPNAYERTGFKIPESELLRWVLDRRASLIRACLVLVRSWIAAGQPEDKSVVRGSFGGWCKVIGGLLQHAQFGGLAGALDVSDRDLHAEDHRMLVRWWLSEFPVDQPLPAITVGELAQRHGLYEDRLVKKGSAFSVGKSMATILKTALVGRSVEGYQVRIYPTPQSGYTCYHLVKDHTGS